MKTLAPNGFGLVLCLRKPLTIFIITKMKGSILLRLFFAACSFKFRAEALSASDFSYFGEGQCSYSSGYQYRVIKNAGVVEPVNSWLVPLPITTTDEYYLDWCSQNDHPDLVGVSVYRDWKVDCRCLFSGGRPTDLGPSDYNPPGYYGSEDALVGEGAVQTTSTTAGATFVHEKCYLNNVRIICVWSFVISFRIPLPCTSILYLKNYGDPSPSSHPSNPGAPSNTPSASLKPYCLRIRLNFHLPPSFSPITPLAPSNFPYIGQGYCRGTSNKEYNCIHGSDVPTTTEDIDCVNWCLQNPLPEPAGVDVYCDSSKVKFYCLIDAFPLTVGPSDYDPVAYQAGGGQHDVTGPVRGTNDNTYVCLLQ